MSEEEATKAAAEAAEGVIFSRLDKGDVEDLDVTVRFTGGELSVDVFLETTDDAPTSTPEEQQIADDAARAAAAAIDDHADVDGE